MEKPTILAKQSFMIPAGVTLCALLLADATLSHSQTDGPRRGPYPNKPIRWVTGGGLDAMARILGQKI